MVKANKGSAGIDGISFSKIEASEQGGAIEFLKSIQDELKAKKYKPKPVKRVYIPKANGKLRPLGIPTIKDRVVQMATMLIICKYGLTEGKGSKTT
ncbi:MAG: hypothetical protein H7A23_25915 [Leptospiraceae bacterium]|nr:hypothetical protein [Leptospiraceae bacterium]